jgi:agmatine/peptidylarginine deiminase
MLKVTGPWVTIQEVALMTYPKRIAMPSNWEPIVQEVQHDFQALVAYVTEAKARAQTAYICDNIREWLSLVSLAPRLPGRRSDQGGCDPF